LATTAEWFPKTSEWKHLARKIEHDRIAELQARLRKLPSPLCLACDDTGWCPSPQSDRFTACDCREIRRLEVLGRRPMPALPPGPDEPDEPDPRVTVAVDVLAARKKMR
jgi:hypothetical protein